MKCSLCTLVHKGKSCRQKQSVPLVAMQCIRIHHTAAISKEAQFNLNSNEKRQKIISSLQFCKVAWIDRFFFFLISWNPIHNCSFYTMLFSMDTLHFKLACSSLNRFYITIKSLFWKKILFQMKYFPYQVISLSGFAKTNKVLFPISFFFS